MPLPYITRVAPSPTGFFHIGTARAAYYSWLAARASKGKFILRIDDTDFERSRPEYVDVILESMKWLGLDYDELHFQSHRLDLYTELAAKLVALDRAYVADGCIRLRNPPMGSLWIDNIAGCIRMSQFDRTIVDGMVLIKSDGRPTYNFASAVDDHYMSVNWIIRGTDHISNTPKQLGVWSMLGIPETELPAFSHVGLIEIMKDGKRQKLSKRDGAASLLQYRDDGYEASTILDYLMRVGWSHSAADYQKRVPIVDRGEALCTFLTEGKLRNAPSLFDPVFLEKLDRRWKARLSA